MIAIVVAMPEELDAILACSEQVDQVQTEPTKLYRARLSGCEVLLCQSGVGKAAAASITTEVILRYQPDFLINVGVAGGLREEQAIGDVILAEGVTYYDLLFYYENPRAHLEPYCFRFRSEDIERMEAVLEHMGVPHHRGWIATGDQFVSHPDQWKLILERVPEAVAAEMESCAIVQVATHYRVPSIVIRSLSDVVLHTENEKEFAAFLQETPMRAAKICAEFVSRYAGG